MRTNLSILLIIIVWTIGYSQQERITIYGTIESDGTDLENIHIINKKSKKGAVTNVKGEFKIDVQLKDTIIITGIQYQYLEIEISKNHINNKTIRVDLFLQTNELDEVHVTHSLTGNIAIDSKHFKIKKNVKGGALDFSNIDLNLVTTKMDASSRSRTSSDKELMPNMNPDLIVIASMLLKPIIKGVSKIGASKRNIKRMDQLYNNKILAASENIRIDFGETFFIETLKIPANHIDGFISSCLPKGIAHLYVNDKKLEIMDILITESKTYLLKIKEEN